jgi:Cu/Zn superoxide dismutase
MAAVVACESSTEVPSTLTFGGTMNGAKEKPTATTSTATGQALVVLNSSGTLFYSVSWSGLTGAVTGAHIHGPADSVNTAGVLLDFSALPVGSANQAITLTASGLASGSVTVKGDAIVTATVTGDSLVKLLNAGLLYVNVHTAANPNGEIRTQLQR